MKSFWDHIKEEKRPVVIYGTGNAAEKLFFLLKERGIRTMAFSSSSSFLRDRSFLGYKVLPLERIREIYGSDIVLLLGFGSHDESVIEHIVGLSKEYDLYMPDLLLTESGEVFSSLVVEREKREYEWAYSLLCDDLSRDVFSLSLEHRLTGRIEPLLKIGRKEEENWNLLKLEDSSSFFDGGAYNGDTISLYRSKTQNKGDIYGIEPSFVSFRRMREKYGKEENIHLYNLALGEKDGEGRMELGHGRGNRMEEGKGTLIRSIDSILDGKSVDFIKLDIEGEEEKALEGARDTICRYKPKLLISAYHRTSDYWRLLRKVFSIRDDYKVYMRKDISLPNWDTYYVLV